MLKVILIQMVMVMLTGAHLVQLVLYPLLEVQRPALASLVELVNVGLAQPVLTVLLARIRA